ncbi:MAG: transglycosylase domain-containing protein [Bacteroidia bacterium]|nr:transglycosylase domain-containing protein [Bacteroidia bacterium]
MDTAILKAKFGQIYLFCEKMILRRPGLSLGLATVSGGGFLSILLIQAVTWGWVTPIPTLDELAHISNPTASEVYSVDGKLLGKYYLENRKDISFAEVPQYLIDALVATEDVRFFSHDGVDTRSLIRVFFKSLILRSESAGGGSTITQQLAKNLFPRQAFALFSLPINKIREAEIAQRLEKIYSKEEIFALYLNTVSFGENVFGIEVAANRFFSTTTANLTPEQSALLIGMLKAPTTYNPRLHPEAAWGRRNVVFDQMVKYDFLEKSQGDSLRIIPLTLNYSFQSHNTGLAPYFREHLRMEMDQWCKKTFRKDGTNYNLYTDGLKIYTTLHSGMQQYAESASKNHMKALQQAFDRNWKTRNKEKITGEMVSQALRRSKRYQSLQKQGFPPVAIDSMMRVPVSMKVFTWEGAQTVEMSPHDSVLHDAFMLHCGLLAIDPQNGQVRAWVGGIDHNYFQYDHVTCLRQTGSIFKPIVYAAALEAGESPCEFISNEKTVFEAYNNWAPKNVDNVYGGEYSMQGALAHSVNVVAVNLIMKIGMEKVVEMSRRLGIKHDLPEVPSLALGAADLSLEEMTGVYSVFVNGGNFYAPAHILRIENREGHILLETSAIPPQRAISERTASMLTYMLESVVNEGTARSLRTRYGLKNDIAGKTGTSQSQADGWFIGATPDLVVGAWVGADDQRVHFPSLAQGQGASTALPIVAQFLQKVYADKEFAYMKKTPFTFPSDEIMDELDCDEFWFPLSMSDFQEWWLQQKEKEAKKNK